jgi:hypothetical protein
MNENITITKAKIKDELFLEAEWKEALPGHQENSHKLSSTVPVAQELKDAFAGLDKYLALLCDQLPMPATSKELRNMDSAGLFSAKGYTITGASDSEGVTVSGNLAGKFGVINLNTPIQKWSTSDFKFASELSQAIQLCSAEVYAYLFEGKRAPDKQVSLEFPEEGANDFEEETPAQKKKREKAEAKEAKANPLKIAE